MLPLRNWRFAPSIFAKALHLQNVHNDLLWSTPTTAPKVQSRKNYDRSDGVECCTNIVNKTGNNDQRAVDTAGNGFVTTVDVTLHTSKRGSNN
jgi:hypothetical protein